MSKRILLVGLILGVIGLALAGCMRLTSLVVTPTSAIVEGGGTVTFTAVDHLGNPVAVIWSVSSGPGTGTITSAGVYMAPPAVSVVTNATITATRVGYPSITGFATVTIKPPINAALVDAAGDVFGLGTYDITGISTSRTSTTLTVTITFDPTTPPTIPALGVVGPGDLAGFVCFDTDEIVATGIPSANFYFCPCGPFAAQAIGSDYFVSLFFVNAAGNYDIYKTPSFTHVGDAAYTLAGTVLTLTIPLTYLGGDDGITDMNAVLGDGVGPTDCIPDEVAAVVTGKTIVPAYASPYYIPFLLDTYEILWGTSIAVTKTADPISVQSGNTVVFTVRVENTGVRAVTLTSLIDVPYGDLTTGDVQTTNCTLQSIAVGDSYECEFEVVVTGNSGESITDTVTAKAEDDDEHEVTASGKATVTIE